MHITLSSNPPELPELQNQVFILQLNGGEGCARLKNDIEFAAIPVIIFTAYSNKGLEKGTYSCDDFIAKPFDIKSLLSRVNVLTENTPERFAI